MATVNIGQAKTDLSRLIVQAESGEDVQIARDGVPVVRLVPVRPTSAGATFLAAHGALAGQIVIGSDFEFTEAELDGLGV